MVWASHLRGVVISETHPKVVYYALTGKVFDWDTQADMVRWLSGLLGISVSVRNEHEFDAILSAYAVQQGMQGLWTLDLHSMTPEDGERMKEPSGPSKFFWPPEGLQHDGPTNRTDQRGNP